MTKIETIIAEIERLKTEAFNNAKNRSLVTDVANSQRIAICDYLLDFITSLPNEKPGEDLNKEIDRFQKAKYGGDEISVASIACHFAIWQKEQNQGYISKLEDICINLWDILDDIDTYSDLKIDGTNPNNPFKIIEEKTKKRHIFIQTDGYDLFLGNKKLVKKEDEQ